ncbi:hypothetical protein M378DRAFT_863471 [Amanita muscaria Koide BX008]|uniref:NACHT domain-containing protein n=1 Tax=Amanita muscaria (strain Koide BX008) TaxID=946122 RepID=A0A0C2WXS8_AMAMK|nr:hypothetical protein M378DRAFT_863471 [Amanita muscaria Koide BX008]
MRDNFPTLNYATLMNIAQSYTSMIDEHGCVSLEKNVVDGESHPVATAPQEPNTGIEHPSIRVEGTLPELPREGSFGRKAKEKSPLQIRRSHSSRGVSQRDKSHEFLPVLDNTANPNIGDRNQSVEIKTDIGKPTDLQEEAKDPQTAIQALEQIGEGVKLPHLDELKGSDDQGGAVELLATPGQSRHADDNPGTRDAEYHETFPPDINAHVGSTQVITHVRDITYHYHNSNLARNHDISILKEFVSFKAIHDSYAQDPISQVHPGTRQYVLKRIQDWFDTPSANERILWLHGPVGVGKSAIAQTVARSCARETLAGTFFFYRSDPGRNDGNRLCTTLAWQFAFSVPATKDELIHSLIERPDIPMKEVEMQFEELIVKPFLALKTAESGDHLSVPVVIIDGIDECSDESLQRRFLKIIGNAVKDNRVPLRFLICSRPEAHIQDVIDIFQSFTLPLDLAELDDANQDIEKYLRDEFSRIATEQGLDPAWPGEQIFQEFVTKASGQFGYASTLIKRLGDEYSSAETQLDIIRGLKPSSTISPFAELDELYKEILSRQRDPVFLKDFLSLLIDRDGMNAKNFHEDSLMNVPEKELHRKLRGMRSLLKLEPRIDVHHRSFLDFLHDPSRSGQYYISKQAIVSRFSARPVLLWSILYQQTRTRRYFTISTVTWFFIIFIIFMFILKFYFIYTPW